MGEEDEPEDSRADKFIGFVVRWVADIEREVNSKQDEEEWEGRA